MISAEIQRASLARFQGWALASQALPTKTHTAGPVGSVRPPFLQFIDPLYESTSKICPLICGQTTCCLRDNVAREIAQPIEIFRPVLRLVIN